MTKTNHLVKRRPRAPSRMDMAEIAEQLSFLAGPFVSKALRLESLAGAEAWAAEATRALGPLLQDARALEAAESRRLTAALEDALERRAPVGRDEIREHATQVGRALTAAWLQFLALALGNDVELPLSADLLPAESARVPRELRQAFEQSLLAFAVDTAAAPKILRAFAEGFVHGTAGLRLPFGLTLCTGAETPYLARQTPVEPPKAKARVKR